MNEQLEASRAKVQEAMQRLTTAHKGGFPWNVRLQLMSEAILAMCESNVEQSAAIVNLLQDFGVTISDLKRKIEAAISK